MTVRLCVLLWARPGATDLADQRDAAIARTDIYPVEFV